MSAEDLDFSKLSDEELAAISNDGSLWDAKDGTKRIPAPLELNAPAKDASGEYPRQKLPDQGSFLGGAGGQLKSYALGAGRLINEVEEATTKEHGAEMQKARATPMGALGSGLANVGVGMLTPFTRGVSALGVAANAGLGGLEEALSDYGEGKPGVDALLQGGARGALGTAVGNVGLNVGAKLVNAGLKKAGMSGRWSSPPDEYVYEFAKSKGVDLRPGDVAGPGVTRALENFHPLGMDKSLDAQTTQLGQALFGNGNQILKGLGKVKEQIDAANKNLWSPVYNIASQPGTTNVLPRGLKSALDDVMSKYPNMVNKIDNVQLKSMLEAVANSSPNKLPGFSFEQVRELQQAIGPEVAKLRTQALNGQITNDEAQEFARLYGSLHGDLTRWGNHGGNKKAYEAYKQANEVYKRDFLPFYNNDIVHNWQRGKYDGGHHEVMVNDLLAPSKKTQVDNLLWYTGQTDHDTTGYIEMLRLADRAGKQLSHGNAEPTSTIGLGTLLSPKLAAARMAGHSATGKPMLTPLYGASPELGPNFTRRGLIGGLGLSSQELLRRNRE